MWYSAFLLLCLSCAHHLPASRSTKGREKLRKGGWRTSNNFFISSFLSFHFQSEMFEWEFWLRLKKKWEREKEWEGEGEERRVLRGWKRDRREVVKSRESGVSPVSPHQLNLPWRWERFNMTKGWKSKKWNWKIREQMRDLNLNIRRNSRKNILRVRCGWTP